MKNIHSAKIKRLLCLILTAIFLIGSIPSATLGYNGDDEIEEFVELIAEAKAKPEVMTEPEAVVEPEAGAETKAVAEPEAVVEPEAGTEAEAEPEAVAEPNTYANSISGMLWLDIYEDTSSGIYNGDGIRQAEEQPLSGYTVILYKESNTSDAIQITTTDAGGKYMFTNIEPGSYIAGIASATIDGIEYLLPLVGVAGDNRFTMASDYVNAYSDTIQVDTDTVVSDIDAGMRTPPTPQKRAAVSVSYYGRLVDQNNNPICNAPVYIALIYNTSWLGAYTYSSSTEYTDNNGYFSYLRSVTAVTQIASNDDIALVIGFPTPFRTSMPAAPYGGAVSVYKQGVGTIIYPNNSSIPSYAGTNPTGFGRTLYQLALYDLRASDTNVSITMGSSSSRQTIRLTNTTVDYTVTENFYGLDTGNPISTYRLSSFGTFYATNNFTGRASTTINNSGKSYRYVGYRLDTTSGPITTGNPPSSYPVSSDLMVNYYYSPTTGYPPAAYEPTYTNGSATSVSVTGHYDLNGGTYQSAWLERSATSAAAGFVSVDGTSNNTTAVALNDSGLTPNTRYWYRTCIRTNYGTDTSAASEFITLPRVDTAAALATGTSTANISGTIALGSENISDVIITYAEDANFTQNAVTLYGSNGDVTFSNSTYSADLTGLSSGQTYYVKVVAKGPGGLSESVEISFKNSYTVTIEYADMNGIALSTQPSPNIQQISGIFSHTPSAANYKAKYYTLSTDSHTAQTQLTDTSPAVSFTPDQDVTVRIYFVSTLIDITVPAGVEFYATTSTNGAVTPDSSSGKDIGTFTNNSDLAVKVSLREMTVNNSTSSELNFVSDVTASTINRRIHLNLVPSGRASNGFTNSIENIVPNSTYISPAELGTLDGTYYTASGVTGTGTGGSGKFETGGQYMGDYPVYPSKYNVDVTFNFYIEIAD